MGRLWSDPGPIKTREIGISFYNFDVEQTIVKMEGKQKEVFTFYYTAPDILAEEVLSYFPSVLATFTYFLADFIFSLKHNSFGTIFSERMFWTLGKITFHVAQLFFFKFILFVVFELDDESVRESRIGKTRPNLHSLMIYIKAYRLYALNTLYEGILALHRPSTTKYQPVLPYTYPVPPFTSTPLTEISAK